MKKTELYNYKYISYGQASCTNVLWEVHILVHIFCESLHGHDVHTEKKKNQSYIASTWLKINNSTTDYKTCIWRIVARTEPITHARWEKHSASCMTSPCDLISSSYIVMTEDLTWQQTQSTDPFSDEAAIQEKPTEETVCLGWNNDAGTPGSQVVFL